MCSSKNFLGAIYMYDKNIHVNFMTPSPLCLPYAPISFLFQFPDLASFLIARACRSTRLANYFHWYVYVECQEDKDPASKEKYESIRSKFLDDLRNVSTIILKVNATCCTMQVA